MNKNDWSQAVDNLSKGLVFTENRAKNVSAELFDLCKDMDPLKLDILKYKLERDRQHMARSKGLVSAVRDKKKLGISLGVAIGGSFLGGLLSNDKYFALNTGMQTLATSLEVYGRSEWAVSLDRSMLVVPRNQIYPGRVWVTWESLEEALERLKKKALAGTKLGNLEAIMSELKLDSQTLRYLIVLVPKQIETN